MEGDNSTGLETIYQREISDFGHELISICDSNVAMGKIASPWSSFQAKVEVTP